MHLFVSDDADLPDLRDALAGLPQDAYGQAFVETVSPEVEELQRPAGVSVTWLVRDLADRSRPMGSYAAVASGAWAAEWMVAAPHPSQRTLVWVGTSIRATVHVLMAQNGCPCLHQEHEHRHADDG
ncbi:SIP domain-containing protein [Ornithinimicrobium murale]|uniref:SIP domain-containing protein n=1 Tax=Ornithinimicrobium murale TaxID=1050153 RepID=UPI0013B37C0D|nr:SIP domain-containing protein [Ornithinimicrobium murale]